MLQFEIPDGSTYRLLYTGPIGVSGVDVEQSWDLTILPRRVREDPTFRDNFRIFVRQIDAGIASVSPEVEFEPEEGLPETLVLTLTAASADNELSVEAWYIYSAVR